MQVVRVYDSLSLRQVREGILHDLGEALAALSFICHFKVYVGSPEMLFSLCLCILTGSQVELQTGLFLLLLHLVEGFLVNFKHCFVHQLIVVNVFGYFDEVYELEVFG